MNKYITYWFSVASLAFCGNICSAQTVSGTSGGHDYVDLGLPSGTKWATCNVGASKPTMFGDYFAWGETKPKGDYNWNTYTLGTADSNGELEMLMKYRKSKDRTTVTLEGADDAATANWGNNWRMPTKEEQDELKKNCNWKWEKNYKGTGVSGYIGTSVKNGNTIFLPAAGNQFNTTLYYDGHYGYYWSSSLDEYNSAFAYGFNIYNDSFDRHNYFRYYGQSVRAVLK